MLEDTYLSQNGYWPRPAYDFGRIWPTPDLMLRSMDARRSVWTNARVGNIMGAFVALAACAPLAASWIWRDEVLAEYDAASTIVKIILWGFVVGIWVIVAVGLAMACFRARLVIDRQLGELQVYAWGRLHDRVRVSDIRLLSHENLLRVNSNDHDGLAFTTQQYLVMELRDGTLVRISSSRDGRMQQLRRQIEEACE